jgi:hypothetical protein
LIYHTHGFSFIRLFLISTVLILFVLGYDGIG